MKIFKDPITESELFSDALKVVEKGDILEVHGAYISRSDKISDAMIGGNASAEGAEDDEVVDDEAKEAGIDVVLNAKLEEGPDYTKNMYKKHMKKYITDVVAHYKENEMDDKLEKLKKFAKGFFEDPQVVDIMENAKDYSWYHGEHHEASKETADGDMKHMQGVVIPVRWEDTKVSNEYPGGQIPIFIFFRPCLIEEKF